MALTPNDYMIIAWVTSLFALTGLAVYAIVYYTRSLRRGKQDVVQDAEFFLTARGTVPWYRLAFSFYATAVGGWMIASPPAYASIAGIVGLVMYALSAGIPLQIIAYCGEWITKRYPRVLSITDFAHQRYGVWARWLVSLVCIFNMAIFLLNEYTIIATIFGDYIRTADIPITIIVGVLTTIYAGYGGVAASIATDVVQGFVSIIFVAVVVIYVAATFREPLPKPMPPALVAGDPAFGPSGERAGLGAIFAMPCSLIAATVFSEALWQRVWASTDRRSLRLAAGLGSLGVILTTFLLGFAGILVSWAGLINFGEYDPVTYEQTAPSTSYNLLLFLTFKDDRNASPDSNKANPILASGIGVIAVLLTVIMNQSVIDSLQTGLCAAISTNFLRGQHALFSRIVVLLINVPLIVVSLQGYPVLNLFLVANMLCICCFLPVLLGLWDGPLGRRVMTQGAMISGCVVAMLALMAYGIGDSWDVDQATWETWAAYLLIPSLPPCQDYATVNCKFANGVWVAWYANQYAWRYFIVAAGFSLVGVLLWVLPMQAAYALTGGWQPRDVPAPKVPHYDLLQLPGMAALAAVINPLELQAPGLADANGGGKAGGDVAAAANGHSNGHSNGGSKV